jgi:hypothetical protein
MKMSQGTQEKRGLLLIEGNLYQAEKTQSDVFNMV